MPPLATLLAPSRPAGDAVPSARLAPLQHILPGLGLSLGLAGAAMALRLLPGLSMLSPAILAILLGMAARVALGSHAWLRPGLAIALRLLLRWAVVLLGLQVTVGQMAALGPATLLAVVGGLAACFLGTVWLGRLLKVEPRLARLIATGTAVCGASAVVAANSVTRGSDEDVAYALATVTLFGTLAMLVAPLVAMVLPLDGTGAGVWLGASIHEIAQVVGAATQLGPTAVQTATIAKMARILMLAPLIFAMLSYERAAARRSRRAEGGVDGGAGPAAKVPVPWFVLGFVALAGVASLGVVPHPVVAGSGQAATVMLAAALAAMGFGVDIKALRKKGIRPILLALSSWLLIAGVSFTLLKLTGL